MSASYKVQLPSDLRALPFLLIGTLLRSGAGGARCNYEQEPNAVEQSWQFFPACPFAPSAAFCG